MAPNEDLECKHTQAQQCRTACMCFVQVADRVLFQHGGQSWWGAIIGRAKLQRAVKRRHNTRLVSEQRLYYAKAECLDNVWSVIGQIQHRTGCLADQQQQLQPQQREFCQ